MQEPLEGISFNFAFVVMSSDTDRASVPASITQLEVFFASQVDWPMIRGLLSGGCGEGGGG